MDGDAALGGAVQLGDHQTGEAGDAVEALGLGDGILAGGQYDALMQKMHRKAKAIGFALYPDLLERMTLHEEEQADTALLYDADAALWDIAQAVESLAKEAAAVNALPVGSNTAEYKKVFKLNGKKVQELG